MPLLPGDLAPTFFAPSSGNPRYNFATVAGRYVLMAFLPPQPTAVGVAALTAVRAHRALFDDANRCFFGVLSDAEQFGLARDEIPGLRWLHDVEGDIARQYELTAPAWVVADPSLRVLFTAPLEQAESVLARFAALAPIDDHAGVPLTAPVLIAPRIFDQLPVP